jgi:hypothetical protein
LGNWNFSQQTAYRLSEMRSKSRFDATLPRTVEQVLLRKDDILITSDRLEAQRSMGRVNYTVNYDIKKIQEVWVSNDAKESSANWAGLFAYSIFFLIFSVIAFLAFQNGSDRTWIVVIFACVFGFLALTVLYSFFQTNTYYVYVKAIPKGLGLYPHEFIVFWSSNQAEAHQLKQDIDACRSR